MFSSKRDISKSIISKRYHLKAIILMLIVALLGIIVGQQILGPSKRVIEIMFAVLFFALAFSLPLYYMLLLLVFLIPFIAQMSFGTTNMVFVYLLAGLWIWKKIIAGESIKEKTPVDLPMLFLFLAYLFSFYNISFVEIYPNFLIYIASISNIVLFYLVVNIVNNERLLYQITYAILLSSLLALLFGVFQIFYPTTTLVTDVLSSSTMQYQLESIEGTSKMMRIVGPFRGYEIFAEYIALVIPLQIFVMLWEKKIYKKIFCILLLVLSCVVLLATATRGGLISVCLGLLYLGFLMRKNINIKKYLIGLILFITIFYIGITFLRISSDTQTVYMFERLKRTTFHSGGIPDTRTEVWTTTLPIALEHPILGHGLLFKSPPLIYPHCIYIYLIYTVGFLGLASFLWLIVKLFRYSNRNLRNNMNKTFTWGLVAVLQVDLVIFVIDEIKIEFLRNYHCNYQHFVFLLFGLLVAGSNILKKTSFSNVNK